MNYLSQTAVNHLRRRVGCHLLVGMITTTLNLPAMHAEGFTHCKWNGEWTACRVTKTTEGVDIYYPNGGETQRIIFAGEEKVWIINDGVKEPGIMKGQTIRRLTDGIEVSF